MDVFESDTLDKQSSIDPQPSLDTQKKVSRIKIRRTNELIAQLTTAVSPHSLKRGPKKRREACLLPSLPDLDDIEWNIKLPVIKQSKEERLNSLKISIKHWKSVHKRKKCKLQKFTVIDEYSPAQCSNTYQHSNESKSALKKTDVPLRHLSVNLVPVEKANLLNSEQMRQLLVDSQNSIRNSLVSNSLDQKISNSCKECWVLLKRLTPTEISFWTSKKTHKSNSKKINRSLNKTPIKKTPLKNLNVSSSPWKLKISLKRRYSRNSKSKLFKPTNSSTPIQDNFKKDLNGSGNKSKSKKKISQKSEIINETLEKVPFSVLSHDKSLDDEEANGTYDIEKTSGTYDLLKLSPFQPRISNVNDTTYKIQNKTIYQVESPEPPHVTLKGAIPKTKLGLNQKKKTKSFGGNQSKGKSSEDGAHQLNINNEELNPEASSYSWSSINKGELKQVLKRNVISDENKQHSNLENTSPPWIGGGETEEKAQNATFLINESNSECEEELNIISISSTDSLLSPESNRSQLKSMFKTQDAPKSRRKVTFSNMSVIIISDNDSSFNSPDRSANFLHTPTNFAENNSNYENNYRKKESIKVTPQNLFPQEKLKIAKGSSSFSANNRGLSKVTKIPNFTLLHKKMYEKMPDIKQDTQMKNERAKLLLSGQKPKSTDKQLLQNGNTKKKLQSKKETRPKMNFTPIKNKSPKLPKKVNISNGFKNIGKDDLGRKDQLKVIINKNRTPKAVHVTEEKRTAVQGFRSNRRFELLMKMRQAK